MSERTHFTLEQKAALDRRHLASKQQPVATNLTGELRIQASQLHFWVRHLLGQADRALSHPGRPGGGPGIDLRRRRLRDCNQSAKPWRHEAATCPTGCPSALTYILRLKLEFRLNQDTRLRWNTLRHYPRTLIIIAVVSIGFALFDAANAQEPVAVKAKDAPIAIVLNKPILASDIRPLDDDKTELRDYRAIAPLIVGPLFTKYVKEHRLEASPSEIKEFSVWASSLAGEKNEPVPAAEDQELLDEIAKASVEEWKFAKALHHKYGGRIELQQAGLEPVEAYRDWLQDEEKAGNFRIFDPRWRAAFWEYYKPKYHRYLTNERDWFSSPPWKTD